MEMYIRKIKKEWIPLIDNLIRELRAKKVLVILFCMLTFALPCFSLTLEGGVTYTEETARTAAFENVHKYLTFPTQESYHRSAFVREIDYNKVQQVYDYKASFALVPMKIIGVIYKDEPNRLYGYIKKSYGYTCICVRVTEGTDYPLRTYNYLSKTGELMSVGFLTGNEEYKFDKNGKLIGYWNANGKFKNKTKLPVRMKQLSVLDDGS